MSISRETAHKSMRGLWQKVDERIRREAEARGEEVKRMETEAGAVIEQYGGVLYVEAEFVKNDGTDEVHCVSFAEDIRDFNESTVEIEWSNNMGRGVNTVPLRNYPKVAADLMNLID